MKKSLLAAGALAALGGLGFAGSAHAVWAVSDVAEAEAVVLDAASNTGVGHILLTPYFSTSESNATLLTIVNTDTTNGKAVKVRFRGAANSDDVLDFTVLLSAGDVWAASVSQGADGFSRLVTPDTSCVLPNIPTVASGGVGFSNARLDRTLSPAAQAAHTQEGYVEWLNMADIPENSTLGKAITHKDNVAPCTSTEMEYLMDPTQTLTVGQAAEYGLLPPTGGLMGNWTIFNTSNVTSYAGPNSAIVAVGGEDGRTATAARLIFTPQVGPSRPIFSDTAPYVGGNHLNETADPLLAGAASGGTVDADGDPVLQMLPFDIPDLSTPYVRSSALFGSSAAALQAVELSFSFAATKVMNEWTAGTDNGTTFSTDWVFTQPTRRYHAVIDYSKDKGDRAAHNSITSLFYYRPDTMIEKVAGPDGAYGSVLCLADGQVRYTVFNREEGKVTPKFTGEWSPATPPDIPPGFCGEVATLTFGSAQSQAMEAKLTTYQVGNLPAGGAGWMLASTPGVLLDRVNGLGLPVIGFAANTFAGSNGSNTGNYGDAITHRYERSLIARTLLEEELQMPNAQD